MNSSIDSSVAVNPAPSNTVELALWSSMNLPAFSGPLRRRDRAIAQLCGPVSRQPLQIRVIPRVTVPVRLPVGHFLIPSGCFRFYG
jgi:hypothetical protein